MVQDTIQNKVRVANQSAQNSQFRDMLLRDLNLRSGESEDEKENEGAKEEEKKTPTNSSMLIQEEDKHP